MYEWLTPENLHPRGFHITDITFSGQIFGNKTFFYILPLPTFLLIHMTLENKTPVETFPKFPSVLRVVDRSDQNPPIAATSVTF